MASRLTPFGLVVLAATVACGGASSPAGGPTSAPASGSTPTSAAAQASKGPTVLGERLTPRVITDPANDNMPMAVVAVPEGWTFTSDVRWNYSHVTSPVTATSRAENPKNEEAVFGWAPASFFTLTPAGSNFYRDGQEVLGLIYGTPVPPDVLMARVIERLRGRETRLQFIGSKVLPDLPAALKLPASPGQQGLAMKVSYEWNGRQVEEEFYGVAYRDQIPYDGPQGRTVQTNWGLTALHSFRGAAGTIDARRPVCAAIVKSMRPNPEWVARLGAITSFLNAEFNRQLQAGYDVIAAAGALSRQISANNDALLATIERQRQASRAAATTPGASGRSAADIFSDLVRGVETVDDPYYGTSQQASTAQFHWTDGYGSYRQSNDVTYDPNRTEVGQWQPMRPVR